MRNLREVIREFEEEWNNNWQEVWEKFAVTKPDRYKEFTKTMKCEYVDDVFKIGDTVRPSDYNNLRPLNK